MSKSGWVLGLLFLSLGACKEGLETLESVSRTLKNDAPACGVDTKTLEWTTHAGRPLAQQTREGFQKKLEELKVLLTKKNIHWDVYYGDEIRSRCKLPDPIILGSPGVVGFVDQLHWALKTLVEREAMNVEVTKIRVVITALKGEDLYEANRKSRPIVSESGEHSINYFVNLGDPATGISFSTLMRNFTVKDLAQDAADSRKAAISGR